MDAALVHLLRLIGEAPNWLRYALAGGAGILIVTGWRWHRFWFSWAVTLLGGLWGLVHAEQYHLSPLVAGVLTAIGTGCVALALTRLLVFVAAGWLCWQTVRLVSVEWANGLVCFMIGGIVSTMLFRVVVRLVTAGVGVWVLAAALGWLGVREETIVWQMVGSGMQGNDLGWLWLGATLTGAFLQGLGDTAVDAWLARRKQAKEKAAKEKQTAAQAA
jgi:hypothetical protein